MRLYGIVLVILLASCATVDYYDAMYERQKVDINDHIISKQFREISSPKIISKLCKDNLDEKCFSVLKESFNSQLIQYYSLAKEPEVVNFCKAFPLECRSYEGIEKQWATNYNKHLRINITEKKEKARDKERTCYTTKSPLGVVTTQCY